MPRAHRVFLPGHVWHITHRCHRREFLLKVRRDRRCWLHWLREARRRFGLCVLNYIVTCNHIHLLVMDQGRGEIAASMQLVAGRTGQAYNERKGRVGAFWQDRYHATAVESDGHLMRCMAYIDLNMVRAGVVRHPGDWAESGYREIQRLPQRYRIIDTEALSRLVGCGTPQALRERLAALTDRFAPELAERDSSWSESIAVGGRSFLEGIKRGLGHRASRRSLEDAGEMWVLRDAAVPYSIDFQRKSCF
jgi:putative transposase